METLPFEATASASEVSIDVHAATSSDAYAAAPIDACTATTPDASALESTDIKVSTDANVAGSKTADNDVTVTENKTSGATAAEGRINDDNDDDDDDNNTDDNAPQSTIASTVPMPVLGATTPASRDRASTIKNMVNVDQLLPGLRRLAVQVSRGEITENERQSLKSELIASLTSEDSWKDPELMGYSTARREANAGIDDHKNADLEESSDDSSSDDDFLFSSPSADVTPPTTPAASRTAPTTPTSNSSTTSSSSSSAPTSPINTTSSHNPPPTFSPSALTSLAVAAARTGRGLPRAASHVPQGDLTPVAPSVSGAAAADDDENDGFKFVMLSPGLCRALTPAQYGGGFVTIKFPEGATRADLKKLVLLRFANEPGSKTRGKLPSAQRVDIAASPTQPSSSPSGSTETKAVAEAKTATPRRKKRMHRLPPGPAIPVCDPEDFSYNQIIGQGGYATVLKATHKQTQQVYAIKIVRKSSVHAKKTRMYLERNILALLDSPFIVKIHGFFEDKTFMAHVLQLVTGGSFYDVEKRLRGGMFTSPKGLPEPLVCFYAAELCVALECMHNRGVVFRDLKPDNILLDADGHLIIIDMGVAYMANEDRKMSVDFDARKLARCTTIVGAHGFRAPEMFDRHGKYGMSVDWWNYGLILYLLLSGKHPLEHESRWKAAMVGLANRDREAAAAEKLVLKPLKRVSDNAKDLVDKLLDRNPLTRIGSVDDADEIMAHPFFKDLNWDRIRTRADPPPIDSKYTRSAKMDSSATQMSHTYKEVLQSISVWEDDLISGL